MTTPFSAGGLLTPRPATADQVSALAGGSYGAGTSYYVDASVGSDSAQGTSWDNPFATVGAAVTACAAGDRILIAPGTYAEAVVIPNGKTRLMLIGVGPRLSTAIQPSAANATAIRVRADDVTVVNLDFATNGTGTAAIITGRRFHDVACKFEGGSYCYVIGPGTVANIAANLDENGSDSLSEDSEFAWALTGIVLQGSDYGAATQNRFVRPRFHNLSTSSIDEAHIAGGAATLHYRNLEVRDALFQDMEDGTVPTNAVILNDNNANTGTITGCRFRSTLTSGKNLVSTLCIWTGNFHPAGLSTGQPS